MHLGHYNKMSCAEWIRSKKKKNLKIQETENSMIKTLGVSLSEEAAFLFHV